MISLFNRWGWFSPPATIQSSQGIRDASTAKLPTQLATTAYDWTTNFLKGLQQHPSVWRSPSVFRHQEISKTPPADTAPKNLSSPPKKATSGWLEALPEIMEAVERADIDFYHIPFSRNVVGNPEASSGLVRFSEYHPKGQPYIKPSVIIPHEISGAAHLEIRPVEGSQESLITRATIDYEGNKPLNILFGETTLEIDCITGITSPVIDYDESFSGRKAVEGVSKRRGQRGDFQYENACRDRDDNGHPSTTSFDSTAEAPETANGYSSPHWLFYFDTVKKSLGHRALEHHPDFFLWATNPAFGFTDPQHYEKLGIPYNTWPRKPGDIIRFFSPMFTREGREKLYHEAPYFNPNSEFIGQYWDKNGQRLPLPTDYREIVAINEARKAECQELKSENAEEQCDDPSLWPIGRQKLPDDPARIAKINQQIRAECETLTAAGQQDSCVDEIPRPRGPSFDWFFGDFIQFPERMAATPEDQWPSIKTHLRFKPGTVLNLPVGTATLQHDTDITLVYSLRLITEEVDGKKVVKPEAHISFEIKNLNLGKTDITVGGYRINVDQQIHIDSMKFSVPRNRVTNADGEGAWVTDKGRAELTLEGLRASDIEFIDENRSISLAIEQAQLESLHYNYGTDAKGENELVASLKNLTGTNLQLRHEMGAVSIRSATIPEAVLGSSEDFSQLSVRIPSVRSEGDLVIQPQNGHTSRIEMEGASELSHIKIDRNVQGPRITDTFTFRVQGSIPQAVLSNPNFGELKLSMNERSTLHQLSGSFFGKAVNDQWGPSPEHSFKFMMDFKLPYAGIELNSPMAKSSTETSFLRNGQLHITQDHVKLDGDLDLKVTDLQPVGTDLLRSQNLEVYPHIKEARAQGSASLSYSKDGFTLTQRAGGGLPLGLSLELAESSLIHRPQLSEEFLGSHPDLKKELFTTQLVIDKAKLNIEDVRLIEYKMTATESGPSKGQLTQIESGPISISEIQGQGILWVNTFLWSYLPGIFPKFGVPLDQVPDPYKNSPSAHLKDPDDLIGHLDATTQERLCPKGTEDYCNFVHVGGISMGPISSETTQEPQGSHLQIRDFVLQFQEPGAGQKLRLGFPEINLRDEVDGDKLRSRLDFGSSDLYIYTDILLKDLIRGFSEFRLSPPPGHKGYQAPEPQAPKDIPTNSTSIPGHPVSMPWLFHRP